ncbi:hypothetical protein [Streptomyces sp. NPDC050422]|uniref:hypothetical protein n=1 Tax=Streptomyces sp. NPDC050422 TaxID=3365614 RepID=UPI00379EB1F1
MQEETGLLVGDPVRTAFLMHIDYEQHPSAFAAAFEVDEWAGDLTPQDDIEQAAFFPLPDAPKLLGELDSATQREPIVGYLTGAIAPGTTWLYRNRGMEENAHRPLVTQDSGHHAPSQSEPSCAQPRIPGGGAKFVVPAPQKSRTQAL